jgi:hypothetical protein
MNKEPAGQMSDGSIALLAGLLSGGFGLLGVFVGYVLEKRSSKKARVSEAVFHVFQQLLILNGNEIFLPQHGPISRDIILREMDKATAIVHDVIDTVAATKGFPHMQEVVTAVTGLIEAADVDEWMSDYSAEGSVELDRVIGLLEKKIENKVFVEAFRNAFEFWSIKTMEKNGASTDEIEDFKKQQKKARK